MTLAQALEAVQAAGVLLTLDDQGPILRPAGRAPAVAVAVLREHRDRVAAVLRLRELHRGMGLSEEDVRFVEEALLSGRVSEVRIVVRGPEGPQ